MAWFVRWIGGVDTAMQSWRGADVFSQDQSHLFQNGKLPTTTTTTTTTTNPS
jgi:hypothetical protein